MNRRHDLWRTEPDGALTAEAAGFGRGSGKRYLLCQGVFCSAPDGCRQSRPKPFGSSTA
jgi:hypothetical protein